MCQVSGVTWYRSRALLSAAFEIRPEGVPVLWALLSHLGKFGAWPCVNTLRGALRRPQGGDRRARHGTTRPNQRPPRQVSSDFVQRALDAYVAGGILVRARRAGLRAWVYRLAEPYASQLDAAVPIPASAESLALKAAHARPSSRACAAPSIGNRSQEQDPPTPKPPAIDVAATKAGGEAPPAPPLFSPAGTGRGAPPPARQADAAPLPRAGRRPEAAVDVELVERLCAWYAGAWHKRHGRAYLPDRRRDPRRIRTLLAWAVADGSGDAGGWVVRYLVAWLRLAGPVPTSCGHALDGSTHPSVRELCRPQRSAAPTSSTSCASSTTPARSGATMPDELRAELARLAGRRPRAAAGG